MEKIGTVLMHKYELGRLLGQGTFAKVYHARRIDTGESVAIKVISKEKVMKVGLMDMIEREVSVMRLVRHPNVVQLNEVMATRTKIFFAMEYVRGGELFAKVSRGRLREDAARKYFRQLLSAVDFCHSRGVCHRDLKPENLLLDANGDLKVSDFGLSAIRESRRADGLLHTTCGTPAYVAPEVIGMRGYDGAKADLWACGVVLYVLLAGFLPFQDQNLMEMYRKISKGEFKYPQWFAPEARKLLSKILDPSPYSRISMPGIMESSWLKKGAKREIGPGLVSDSMSGMKATSMNAFEIISLSPGFNLSGLFEKDASYAPEARFGSSRGTSTILSRLEEVAGRERFSIRNKEGRVKLESSKEGRKGVLAIEAEIFEIAPSLHMVELKKAAGDTWEYNKFCDQDLKPALKDIVWSWEGGDPQLHPQASSGTQ